MKKRKNILHNILRYILLATNILVSILLIFSAYSDRISPEQEIFFSYLGLVYPFICMANMLFIFYWLLARKWFLLISLFSFLVCWEPTRNYFPLHPNREVPDTDVIKVLTYNVMGFANAVHTDKVPNRIVRYIAQSGADIVCLQEYTVREGNDKRLTSQKLNEALSMYPYYSVVRLKNLNNSLAIYSKYPILLSRPILYSSHNNGSSIHLININGKTLTLINNHLESFKLTSRDKSHYSDFITEPGPEHFDELRGTMRQKLGPAFLLRAKQARIIAEEIRKIRSDYTIVCGDFNDTPISYAHRTIQGNLRDAYADSGWGPSGTYNQNYFWFRIDHILFSPNMEVFNCTVDKVKYSDHYPVWCYLKLN
ncbi:MAG: endonuclease/exonuclease/phosphatase family protein [Tannerellaceae bacterium]|jgi:endonuclease/exonuclease/phosphatase family metal-dependent hydrolase|nr:endonuclease/exonuclease/phosphatase family protein [Tannerellaceae bacterium]